MILVMCRQCWNRFGAPQIISPEIIRAAELVNAIYNESEVGIPLHTWLDDWNIESPWYPWPEHRSIVSAEIWQIAEDLCSLAEKMTIPERASFLALASGYFEKEEEI